MLLINIAYKFYFHKQIILQEFNKILLRLKH